MITEHDVNESLVQSAGNGTTRSSAFVPSSSGMINTTRAGFCMYSISKSNFLCPEQMMMIGPQPTHLQQDKYFGQPARLAYGRSIILRQGARAAST
jgi:hypothetical protein